MIGFSLSLRAGILILGAKITCLSSLKFCGWVHYSLVKNTVLTMTRTEIYSLTMKFNGGSEMRGSLIKVEFKTRLILCLTDCG